MFCTCTFSSTTVVQYSIRVATNMNYLNLTAFDRVLCLREGQEILLSLDLHYRD
jgi:hypothetical protein